MHVPIRVCTFAATVAALFAAVSIAPSSACAAALLGPLDQPPVASDGAATIELDTPTTLTLVASDIDGDALRFAVVTPPAHGSLGPIAGNTVAYTPDQGYLGTD